MQRTLPKSPCLFPCLGVRKGPAFLRPAVAVGFLFFAILITSVARAGAPPVLWSTNVGGQLFAVDTQTNSYVNQGGSVVVVNRAGVPVQTNAICPLPGIVQRDAAGNYYFAGTMTPPVNFGGITLSSNVCYLAKYTSSGTLIWATGFISTNAAAGAEKLNIGDLQLDSIGDAYVSVSWLVPPHGYAYYYRYVLRFDAGGVNTWQAATINQNEGASDFDPVCGPTKLGLVSSTNCFAITSVWPGEPAPYVAVVNLQAFSDGTAEELISIDGWTPAPGARPVGDGAGDIYVMADRMPTKLSSSGKVIWQGEDVTDYVNAGGLQTTADDQWGGFHAADGAGNVARFDSAGNMAWLMTLPNSCGSMIVDARGNRFISDTSGVLYALPPEEFTAPVITNAPAGFTVMAGSIVTLYVGASGGSPLSYGWFFQNNPIPGADDPTLVLTNTTSAKSGNYTVVVSNTVGSVTSAPAVVRFKNVELATSGQLLANGSYDFTTNPVISILSLFTNGSAYYTLDGSPPSFLSTPYTGPFTITSNTTIAAIGYSADFSQSEYADTVVVELPPKFVLSAWTLGGGTVALNPPGGSGASNNVTYLSNSVVSATATAAPGWSFLDWQGGATGTNPTISLTLNQDTSVQAVFGTTLFTTVAGNGQVVVYPSSGPYAYGTVVRLQGIPGVGSYFGAWGNASASTTDPLYFIITNANPTISSIFATIPANEVSFTTEVIGQGRVGVNPAGNVFPTGQSVTLTAIPDAGQSFTGWSGGATGSQNPLTVTLNQSAIITANFTGGIARLTASKAGQTSAGFTLTLISDPGSVYQIQVSTNLSSWQSLGTVTNVTGQAQFTDTGAVNSKARFYRAQQ